MQALFDSVARVANAENWRHSFAEEDDWRAVQGFERFSPAEYEQMLLGAGFSRFSTGSLATLLAVSGMTTVLRHISRHDGLDGVRSRLQGAWTEMPGIASCLPMNEQRTAFLEEVAVDFARAQGLDGAAAGVVIPLSNSLLVAEAVRAGPK